MPAPVRVHSWPTPNGHKVHILLEELGLPYEVVPVNIGQGEQFHPGFLAITPNHRIPAIEDPEGPEGAPLALFESGAILLYLCEKTGSPLLPATGAARHRCLQWLMFQMGGVGPMFGQAHHFLKYNRGKAPYAEERYAAETKRLYGVLNKQLGATAYVAGKDYSIADVAIWPWVSRYDWHIGTLEEYPHVIRWYRDVASRPAVQRGYHVPIKQPDIPMP
jgi:GST-like protein